MKRVFFEVPELVFTNYQSGQLTRHVTAGVTQVMLVTAEEAFHHVSLGHRGVNVCIFDFEKLPDSNQPLVCFPLCVCARVCVHLKACFCACLLSCVCDWKVTPHLPQSKQTDTHTHTVVSWRYNPNHETLAHVYTPWLVLITDASTVTVLHAEMIS